MRRGNSPWRRLVYLATVLALVLSLAPIPAFSPPIARAADTPAPPAPDVLRGTPPTDPRLPSLRVEIAVAPDPLAIGTEATVTITVSNESDNAATDLSVSVAAPNGAVPQPGKGYVSAKDGWVWPVGALVGKGKASVTGTLLVTSPPPGDALQLEATASAAGLPEPLRAVGGALFDPLAASTAVPSPQASLDPRSTAARGTAQPGLPGTATVAPSAAPAPSDEPRAVPFTPGRDTTVVSANGRVRVAVPGAISDKPLTISQSKRPLHGEVVPPTSAGRVGDLGTFYLGASDAAAQSVHQLRAPVTITVGYTPEQLRARGIAAGDLSLFWYDEGAKRWVAIPSRVDAGAGEVVAQVAHFSAFTLADGSAPSTNYLPSLQGWQPDLFTGAATYSLPIDVPAGPGGIKPDLTLGYNSQATDGPSGVRPQGRAGWAGLGWSLDTGSVSLQRTYADDNVFYSLTFNGKAYTLTRGNALVGSPSKSNPADWEWRTTDESYIRVRAVANGSTDGSGSDPRTVQVNGSPVTRYTWRVRTTDNMVYEFAEDLWQGFDNCAAAGEARFETYQWMLTKVTDAHGNQLTYTYDVLSWTPSQPITCSASSYGGGTVQFDARPTSITWGANVTTGAPDRYKVRLYRSDRTSDTGSRPATGQYGGADAAPRPVGVLDGIWVYSNSSNPYADTAAAWQIVRGYTLTHDYTLHCDNTVNGDNDPSCPRLTLKSIQRWGNDAAPGTAGTALPATTLTYGTARGTNVDWPNGNWNRLATADNGQGGTVTFNYEQIGPTAVAPVKGTIFANRRRVQSRVETDGRGNSYTWQYQYTNPELNSLGWQLGGYNMDGTTNETQQYPNSAALYLGWRWASNSYNWLVIPPSSEFRGHSKVRVIDPTGNYTDHWFYQGDVGCTPTATGTTIANYDGDTCFTQLRDNEFRKGREYKTDQYRGTDNALMRSAEHTYAVDFGTAPSGYTTSPDVGIWRAWTREIRTIDRAYEGTGTPAVKTTNYDYDATNYQQGTQQYGNVTRIAEYDGDWVANNAVPRVRLTERWYNTLDDTSNLQVATVQKEAIRGATDGDLLALTNNFYDGLLAYGVGAKGELQLVRKHANPATKDKGSDTTCGYDPYGNPTSMSLYSGYATSEFGAVGGGTAARTTTMTFDPLFHVFMITSTPPDPNAVNLAETATYDTRMGTLTSVTDPNGATTSAEYDVFGRVAKVIKPGDTSAIPTSQIAYYDNDFAATGTPTRYIVTQLEIAGNAGAVRPTSFYYDGLGRQVQTKRESADGTQNIVTDTQYDGLDRVVKASQARYVAETSGTFYTYTPVPTSGVRWTTTTYDPLGRTYDVTMPDNTVTQTRYYGTTVGMATSVTDANGHKTRRETDLFGRLRTVLEYTGNADTGATPYALYATTTYTYDGRDLLTGVADQAGNATTIGYDGNGRKTSMTDPDMGAWSYAYNPTGTLATQTDAKAQTITFAYDTLDRLTGKTYSTGQVAAQYTYDQAAAVNGKGRRTSMADGPSTTNWRYDARGNVTRTEQAVAGVTGTLVLQQTYDSADRVATMTHPGGEVLTYGYDAAWRQTGVCSSLGGCYAQNATYTALDQPATTPLGNGLADTRTYNDPNARLTQLQVGPGVLDRSYTYDAVGNVKRIADNLLGQTQYFGYDERDRLVHAGTTAFASDTQLALGPIAPAPLAPAPATLGLRPLMAPLAPATSKTTVPNAFQRAGLPDPLNPQATSDPAAAATSVAPAPSVAPTPSAVPSDAPSAAPSPAPVAPDQGKLPFSFIPNAGQTDKAVRYEVRRGADTFFFTPDGVTFALHAPSPITGGVTARPDLGDRSPAQAAQSRVPQPPSVARLRFAGASDKVDVRAESPLEGTANYLRGDDPAAWQTDLPTYAAVVYAGLYPGVDLRYEGTANRLKGTYTVAPGADPAQIRWGYGAKTLAVVDPKTGDLTLTVPTETPGVADLTLAEAAPVAWQERDGKRTSVDVRYTVGADGQLGFAVGAYDRALPLVIDPTITYSTYLGSGGNEDAAQVAVDGSGNAYVTGKTWASDFPTVNPKQATWGGQYDAFVVKLNAAGTALVYSTYLGGSGWDEANGIAVDGSGRAAIGGTTNSTNFPILGGYSTTYRGGAWDAFVAQLTPTGNALRYSTYLGTAGDDEIYGPQGVAVDAGGNLYVTGSTDTTGFPTKNGYSSTLSGPYGDIFLTKFNPAATGAASLVYGTLLGGSGYERGTAVTVSGSTAYLTGITASANFPVRNAAQATKGSGASGDYDAFVAAFNTATTGNASLLWATYLGGNGYDSGSGLALAADGGLVVGGYTEATDFPTLVPYQAAAGGAGDGFVARYLASSGAKIWATYLGGSAFDEVDGVAVDGQGRIYLAGSTKSANYPTYDAPQPTKPANSCSSTPCADAVVTVLTAVGNGLLYSTYLGGTDDDYGRALALGGDGAAYIVGQTNSSNFPTTVGAYDTTKNPLTDMFVTKLAPIPAGGGTPAAYDETYAYDTVGNFVTKAGVAYAGYGNGAGNSGHAHAPATVGGLAYAYDANGNVTSGGSRTYIWDANNQPTSIVGPDGVTETYGYDADGVRVSRTRAGVTTTYLGGVWEQDVQSGSSTKTRAFVMLQERSIAQRERVVSPASDATIYLSGDHLGGVSAATSSTGAILSRQAFTPWGELRAGGGDITQTTRDFTGQKKDDTGLLFYNARYYDPKLGRFTSADSIAPGKTNPQARNRYSFVLNNPLRFTDPTGHCYKEDLPGDAPSAAFDEQQACLELSNDLSRLNINVVSLGDWTAAKLRLVRQAIQDLMTKAHWSASDFKQAMGGVVNFVYGGLRGSETGGYNGGTVTLYAAAFGPNGLGYEDGDRNAKWIVVHELAHRWDEMSGDQFSRNRLSTRMMDEVGGGYEFTPAGDEYHPGQPDQLPSGYIYTSHVEDFAESVAATVYGTREQGYTNYNNSGRDQFVQRQFSNYRQCGPGEGC